MILVDRTLADSQELFIAISNSYSFPGTHYVTSKERADGEIVISPIINTPALLCLLLSPFFFFLNETTPPRWCAHCSNALACADQRWWRNNHRNISLATEGLPYAPHVNRAKRRYYSRRDVMRRGGCTSEEASVTLLTDSHLSNGQREEHTCIASAGTRGPTVFFITWMELYPPL